MPLPKHPSGTPPHTPGSPITRRQLLGILVAATAVGALVSTGVIVERAVEEKKLPKTKVTPGARGTLKGTRAAKQREEQRLRELGLDPYDTLDEIKEDLARGNLVRVRDGDDFDLDPRMGSIAKAKDRPYYQVLHPHTKALLLEITDSFEDTFGKELKVTSLTRTMRYLRQLARRNPNVSMKSSHLYGVAFDLSYAGLSKKEYDWLFMELAEREGRGDIEAVRERHQTCFHIMDRHAYAR